MAVKIQHAVADGPGLVLLAAVAEMARGAAAPTVRPVWGRELLMALTDDDLAGAPRTFANREYDDVPDTKGTIVPLDSMTHRSFFFGPREVAAVRSHLSPSLHRGATTFEVLTGCLWRCRTVALAPAPDEEMRMVCLVSVRGGRKPQQSGTVIPVGYYGNAFAFPVAVSTAGDLCTNPVSYAVELVMKAKREVNVEYLRPVARLMVRRGRPHFSVVRAYLMSDLTRSGIRDLDYGWGKPVYAGPAKGGVGAMHPRSRQLPHRRQERHGRGRHRRARVPARHGQVHGGDEQADAPGLRRIAAIIGRRVSQDKICDLNLNQWSASIDRSNCSLVLDSLHY
ncbi:hypothetical protein ACQ4PT_000598 [Festuca glaucescens]